MTSLTHRAGEGRTVLTRLGPAVHGPDAPRTYSELPPAANSGGFRFAK